MEFICSMTGGGSTFTIFLRNYFVAHQQRLFLEAITRPLSDLTPWPPAGKRKQN